MIGVVWVGSLLSCSVVVSVGGRKVAGRKWKEGGEDSWGGRSSSCSRVVLVFAVKEDEVQ